MRDLVCVTSRYKADVDTFHKGIQYPLEKLGKSKFCFERTAVSNFKSKRHEGSGNELVDYSRAPCLGADHKAPGLWERDCLRVNIVFTFTFKILTQWPWLGFKTRPLDPDSSTLNIRKVHLPEK